MTKRSTNLSLKDQMILSTLQTKNATTKKKSNLIKSMDNYAVKKEPTIFRIQKCCISKGDKENI